MRTLLLACALLLAPTLAFAQGAGAWRVETLAAGTVPAAIVPDTRALVPGFPDARVSTIRAPSREDAPDAPVAAWYDRPTNRYAHGALGDTLEGGRLVVRRADGRRMVLDLPVSEVFEDIAPRLADLDGDGIAEVVAIRASLVGGAALTIYGVRDERLEQRASTPFIGRPNRWLNVAGIGPFLGGPTPEIAAVVTPHIGGRLVLLKLVRGRLVQLSVSEGFSNHALGSPELRLSALADTDGDGRAELVLPSADRKSIVVVAFTQAGARRLAEIPLPAAVDRPVLVEGRGAASTVTLGLTGGAIVRLSR